MTDLKSEGHLNGLTLAEFVEHLRSSDPKTAFDDERAANEIEELLAEIERLQELIREAIPLMKLDRRPDWGA